MFTHLELELLLSAVCGEISLNDDEEQHWIVKKVHEDLRDKIGKLLAEID